MARRSRSHTKRRKSRRGGAWYNPEDWFGSKPTVAEGIVPEATPALDAASSSTSPVVPPGVAPESPGVNTLGGRRRRSRKTRRRRGRK
jgi:hypothetical protein